MVDVKSASIGAGIGLIGGYLTGVFMSNRSVKKRLDKIECALAPKAETVTKATEPVTAVK